MFYGVLWFIECLIVFNLQWRVIVCIIILILSIVTVECAHSKKHKLRLLYVDICKFVMELFSKSFFKQHFCEALLQLAGVSISTVHT